MTASALPVGDLKAHLDHSRVVSSGSMRLELRPYGSHRRRTVATWDRQLQREAHKPPVASCRSRLEAPTAAHRIAPSNSGRGPTFLSVVTRVDIPPPASATVIR